MVSQNFIPKLKDHLLSHLLGHVFDSDEFEYMDEEHRAVRIIEDRIYSAKLLQVNYTTYDMRCDQDTINPQTHCNVMVLLPESSPNAHPYWYAHVLGVFHAKVMHTGGDVHNCLIQHMEFLWVRWFSVEPGYRWGFKTARLPKVGFVPDTDDAAFGFLDPSLVIQGCHLVPSFADGRTSELLRTSTLTAARPTNEVDDWLNYYVMM